MRGEIAADFALLAALYALLYALWLRRRGARYRVRFTLFYLYLCLTAFVTLMPFQLGVPGSDPTVLDEINLEPFRDIKCGYLGAWRGVILNGVMFLPMGFLLPALKRRGLVKTALLSLAASLFIEGTQLFYCWCDVSNRRIFDVTDLIMNTAGGVCGCLIYLAARPALRRIDNELP